MSRKYRVVVGGPHRSGTGSPASGGSCRYDDFSTPAIFGSKSAAQNAINKTTEMQREFDRCTMYRDLPQFAALRFDGIPQPEPFEEASV